MTTRLHHCTVPRDAADDSLLAVTDCVEYEDGTLVVDNGEYGNEVNFCPYCGYEAKVKIRLMSKEEWEKREREREARDKRLKELRRLREAKKK